MSISRSSVHGIVTLLSLSVCFLLAFLFLSFCSLSGNPPFYDETEEENTDLHNRIIFCRIVAGDFEFDSPYWDDISPAGIKLHHMVAVDTSLSFLIRQFIGKLNLEHQ